jgi:hypothetical protein
MTPTILKHLDSCANCLHQRIQHNDETGECMIGSTMMRQQCPCPGFEKK